MPSDEEGKKDQGKLVSGALFYSVAGVMGKCAVSLFNPSLASTVGGFITFAGIGVLASPIIWGLHLIADRLPHDDYLKEYPALHECLEHVANWLIELGAVIAAVAMVGTPFAVSVLCMMVIPTACTVINVLSIAFEEEISECMDNVIGYFN